MLRKLGDYLLGFSLVMCTALVIMFFMYCSIQTDKFFDQYSNKETQRIMFERGEFSRIEDYK